MILLVIYGAYKGTILVYKLYPSVSMQLEVLDLGEEPTLVPADFGFDIAFGLGEPLDPKYGYYEVRETRQYFNASKQKDKIRRTLPLVPCAQMTFNYSNWTEADIYGVSSYQCMSRKDFRLQGQFYSNNFSYVEIRLFRCVNTTKSSNCASNEAIDAYFLKKKFNVAFVNHFFDIKDFESPVKSFIDDSLFWHIEVAR
jgi:hypothetical protein